MKRFEYCFFQASVQLIFSNGQTKDLRKEKKEKTLEDLGKDGWEMVGCDSDSHIIYFKREI